MFSGSIGIHESLIQLLLSLSTKSILFGSFCKGVNEVYRIKHSKAMVNYLDSAYDHTENKKKLFTNKEFIPEMFSSFSDHDKYNGILLREAILKKIFLSYVRERESYMQQSF